MPESLPPEGPVRQVIPAPGPRRLHPASPFLDLSALARQALAPGAVALGTGGLRLLAVGIAVVLALQILAWRRRTYLLAGGVLRVESGLVVRSSQLLPCERIQQVTLVQKLRHRALGVAVLDVEAAGSEARARLEVLELAEAQRLRSALLAARDRAQRAPAAGEEGGDAGAGPGSAPRWVPTPWPVVELTHRQLALAGVTGVELLVVFALAAAAGQLARDLSWSPFEGGDLPAAGTLGPLAVAAAVLGLLVLWLGSAVAASILADSGYRLTLVGDQLHLVRGLLDRKEASLPLVRVQSVRITASAPRRLLGLVSVRIDSAGGGSGEDDRRVRVPVLPVAELDRVLELVLPGAAALPPLRPPPRAALRRSVVRHVVPAAGAAAVVAAALRPWGVLAMALVPMAAGTGVAAYRGLGHAVSASFLVTRSGSFNRRTVVVPLARVQSSRLRASPWQRHAGLATLWLDLAGPGPVPRVRDEAAPVGEQLLSATTGGGRRAAC